MKKICFYLLFLVVVIIGSYSYALSEEIKLIVDNRKVELDTSPVIRQATVFVPLRGVFEEFKAHVSYDKATNTIKARRGKDSVILVIDSTKAKINGADEFMPMPPFILNQRALVPLRFLSEALGCTVKWDIRNSTIYIDSKGKGFDTGKKTNIDINDIDDIDTDKK